MKRLSLYIGLDLISIMFMVLGCSLFFGFDNNSESAISSKMYEHFNGYESLIVNKFPILHTNPELFGMFFSLLGFSLMAMSFFLLKNSK